MWLSLTVVVVCVCEPGMEPTELLRRRAEEVGGEEEGDGEEGGAGRPGGAPPGAQSRRRRVRGDHGHCSCVVGSWPLVVEQLAWTMERQECVCARGAVK